MATIKGILRSFLLGKAHEVITFMRMSKAMIAAGNRLVNKNTMIVTAMRLIVGIVLSDEVHSAIIMP